jgi:hypothetical protein
VLHALVEHGVALHRHRDRRHRPPDLLRALCESGSLQHHRYPCLRQFLFNFRESPKYLLSRGKDAEAIEVLHSIARFNRQPLPSLTLDTFRALDQEQSSLTDPTQPLFGTAEERATAAQAKAVATGAFRRLAHLKGLFSNKWTTITVLLLWLAYIGDFWAFNIAGGFLPIILRRFSVDQNQTLKQIYRNYIAIYTPGMGGSVRPVCLKCCGLKFV